MKYVRHILTAAVLAAVFASHFILGEPQRGPDPVAAMRAASGIPIADPGDFAPLAKPGALPAAQGPAVSPLGEAMRGIGSQDKWTAFIWTGAIIFALGRLGWRIFRFGQGALRALAFTGSAARKLLRFPVFRPRQVNLAERAVRATPAPKPQSGAAPSRPAAEFPTRAKFFGG